MSCTVARTPVRRMLGVVKLVCIAYAFIVLSAGECSAGWKPTFCEDFERPSLGTRWKLSDLWTNQTLPDNNEKQCYIPAGVEQTPGRLRLTATKQSIPAEQCHGATFDLNYASGMVTTAGCNIYEEPAKCAGLSSFSQAYGYFEISARLPKGKGLWPAFWLLPIDGSWPPEIDVIEVLGHDISRVYTTYHYRNSQGEDQATGSYVGPDLSEGFNSFGIDWEPGRLIWYLNGKKIFEYSGSDVSDKPMYMLLNLAVGGTWPGDPDEMTRFPASMEIAYVHVFRQTNDDNANNAVPTGVASCDDLERR